MLAQLQLSGDLASLLRDYLEQEQDIHCELYTHLQGFGNRSRISFAQWWMLLDKLQLRFPERHIGLELGQKVRAKHLGVLGYLTLASDTVVEALLEFQRYQALLHDGDKASVDLRDERMILYWSNEFGPSSRLSDEVLVVGLLSFVRAMTGLATLPALAVEFSFPAPANIDAYAAVLGIAPCFSQARTALHFPAAYLSLPVSNSDPGLKILLARQAQASLAVLPQSEGFISALRSALLRSMQSNRANAGAVANMLNMSERTLFRRLAEQSLTFKTVLAQTRMQLAKEYLQDGDLRLDEIALLLGYSEQSAFNRAFKRETATTPGQFQRLSLNTD
jgi:AraC-like DNA-binding protein